MLEKYKELLNKAKSARLETLTAWYSVFRMREDPFLSQISPDEIEYFVNREKIVDSIIYDIGVASRGIPITTLIVGPFGSGKTSTLRYISSILNTLKDQNPDEYSFNGELFASNTLFEKPDESEEDPEEVQIWVKIGKIAREYLLIDDAKPAQVKTIMREFTRTRLKVFTISPLDFNEIYSNFQITPKTLLLHPFDVNLTGEMLNRRIKRVLTEEDSDVSISYLFDQEALEIIHNYSMQVPYLILKCASNSLKLFRDIYNHEPTYKDVKRQNVTSDIAIRACKITKCFYTIKEFENLSRTKLEVLRQTFPNGKTPTELSVILRKDRTTISRHLSDLRKKGLVEFTSRGREAVYKATESVKVRFEIENMPNGDWNNAST